MRFLIILAAALLAACSEVPMRTLAALNQVDPLTADPAGFEMTMTLPEGVVITDMALSLTLESARDDTGEAISEQVVMQQVARGDTRLFRVAPEDLPRLRLAQATVAQWEQDAPDANRGSLSVFGTGCVAEETVPPDARVSVGLRVEPDGPVLPLLRNVAVFDFFAPGNFESGDGACG